MKLIKIEAFGFKSFADKVTLKFDGGVVGIVGPNGSGKSNINDAIRWVLGEQSSKALRGDSMEDVIFAGSKTVSSLDKAEVVLTFDNSNGIESIPHKKFTISRVLHRGKGSNQYYINGEVARHKDIKEIAMESGISKTSLAIISQGTISSIAEASPEERRGIFEEASGTSKYKARKIETLRKLDKTDEALEKISLIVNELDKQLKPLKKQAEKALLFLEKSENLKKVEVGLLVKDLHYYNSKLESLSAELQKVDETNGNLNSRIQNLDLSIEENIKYKHKLEQELNKLMSELEEISEQIKKIEINKSKEAQRLEMLINGEIQASSEERSAAIKVQLEELTKKIEKYKQFEEETQNEVLKHTSFVQEKEKQISDTRLQESSISSKLNNLKSRIEFLKESRDRRSNLFKGTKVIVDNKHLFKGYKGMVSELIKVEDKYSTAIETILNNALQNIVVDVSETAIAAVNFLKNNNAGKATFIPLSSIKPKGIREDHEIALRGQSGFVGTASSLVQTTPEFLVLSKFLLGHILVVETVEDANRISKLMDTRYMVVSLDGDIIRVGGVISGGAKQEVDSQLSIDKKIKEFEALVPEMEEQKIKCQKMLLDLENSKSEKATLANELRSTLFMTKEKRISANDQFISLKQRYESLTKEVLELEASKSLINSEEDLESKKALLSAEIRTKREKINLLNADQNRFASEKNELEKTLRELNNSFSLKISEKNKAEFLVDNAQKRLSEHYRMTLENASENYSLEMPIEEAREYVDTLKSEIESLGNINIEAIESFKEVESRYNETKASQEELQEAKNIIIGAIAEMDKIIIKRITQTVNLVNEEFKNVFQKMFGGGDALIKYTDPNNILETGIEIIAQPPGKSVKNLKLFSGGEKALIAISLLFAILKAKPIPLCILDEVEAALDESNVVRYAEFLQKLKDTTQFIVITHRHGTMSRVDHLFGATMQKRGVTSFFSVELSKAKELIEKNQNV